MPHDRRLHRLLIVFLLLSAVSVIASVALVTASVTGAARWPWPWDLIPIPVALALIGAGIIAASRHVHDYPLPIVHQVQRAKLPPRQPAHRVPYATQRRR